MPDYMHAIIIILVMGAVTLATRLLPMLIFGRGEKVPDVILYLGKVVPYAAMGLLIVHCLRNVSVSSGSHALPEAIALAAVEGTYIWKRNTILSVVLGTALYMTLVRTVFRTDRLNAFLKTGGSLDRQAFSGYIGAGIGKPAGAGRRAPGPSDGGEAPRPSSFREVFRRP